MTTITSRDDLVNHVNDVRYDLSDHGLTEAEREARELAWWAWHDADYSRHSSTLEEAEERCAAWVDGTSDDGPEALA